MFAAGAGGLLKPLQLALVLGMVRQACLWGQRAMNKTYCMCDASLGALEPQLPDI